MEVNKEIGAKYPWGNKEWKTRTLKIARLIPAGSSLVDIGGGKGNLYKYLKAVRYFTIDNAPWTDETIVADFNKGEYPNLPTSQFVVAQGIIEYMEKPKEFLQAMKKYGDILIITYRTFPGADKAHGAWRFKAAPKLFEKTLGWTGWRIEFSSGISAVEKIYYCTHD